MFPLEFPLRILAGRAGRTDWVLDPFSGRGTTNYAARLLGLPSIGIDSSRVAIALTEAKLANTTPEAITACADRILGRSEAAAGVPQGDFWSGAFHRDVLEQVCRIREALLADCRSASRKALRAVLMGALHGPRTKAAPSHLSNQCTRTYAPKPRYAAAFWRSRGLKPPLVDIRAVIRIRAERYFTGQPHARGIVLAGDSRSQTVFDRLGAERARWIVTSPPYYGMRTYIPDQWLRNWFLGGPSDVDYSNRDQLDHGSPLMFADQLRAVWQNVASVSVPAAQLVIRFGGIADRNADPLTILKQSLIDSPWVLATVKAAGSADSGRRQAIHFARTRNASRSEYDAWARLS